MSPMEQRGKVIIFDHVFQLTKILNSHNVEIIVFDTCIFLKCTNVEGLE